MENSRGEASSPKTRILIGSVLIGLSTLAIFLLIRMNITHHKILHWIVYLVLSIGAVFLISCIPGVEKAQRQNKIVVYFGAISILPMLLKYGHSQINSQIFAVGFSITIRTHGPNGIDDIALRNEGKAKINFPGCNAVDVNESGEAIFAYIPENHLNQKYKIIIEAPTFKSAYPDSLFTLDPENIINLQLIRKGLGYVSGWIFDSSNSGPVDSASVSVAGLPGIFSNKQGFFEVIIPPKKQSERQTLTVTKDGYEFHHSTTEIDSTVSLKIILKRSK